MAPKSIKTEICHILTELRGKDFEKFCFHLTDSSEEPRIRAGEVEGKSREDITTLLVSRCTGAGALHRTITTLRHIGCNEEAQELAKATRDLPPAARTRRQSMSPPVTFSPGPGASAAPDTHRAAAEERRSASHLNETPSVGEPGPSTVQTNGSVQTPQVKKKRPKAERKLSQQKLLFGQYKGNSFEWLLQNHVSYAGYVVATHRKERDDGSTAQSELMKNKDDLAEYVSLFPEAEEEVHFYNQGEAPLGFGKYKKLTHKKLYNDVGDHKKKYVKWLRSQKNNSDPKTAAAAKYVLHRDWRKQQPGISKPATKKQKL